ncbi:thioredoxin-like protein [hydrothermal vent metagenome]|uniref:Thioredoxin-like protein n=1 Tax=hydrothermal vent metagenome TaxID=652676 RepID=A0A3B1CET2_9ZZZZ
MKWLTNIDEAKEESLKSRKPILLQFEMDGCGGCKKLYNETYTNSNVEKEMTEWFILLKLDLIKDREIRRELSGYWTPSFYFLDYSGKSHFNFNGYLPAEEFRIILRLGFAETQIPKGRYADAIEIMNEDIDEFKDAALLPKLLATKGIAAYIKTKDKETFMKTMKEIQQKYPESLEAKMYFWDK